jgi:UDP:flavonoid glycosyltransferase YjiC (YdhE family)
MKYEIPVYLFMLVTGVFLTRRMSCLFKMPIIALYGWPDAPLYAARLLEAGTAAALKLPCQSGEMKQALRHCLRRRAAPDA